MFDIGWSELVVIAVVALIAIGPKELPGVLRMVGQWMGKARKMAAEFQGQFQEAMREAEMADLKKSFDEVKEAATGFTGGRPVVRAGSFNVGGDGTVTGVEDYKDPSTGRSASAITSGLCKTLTQNRGTLLLTTAAGSATYDYGTVSSLQSGQMQENDGSSIVPITSANNGFLKRNSNNPNA